MILVKTGKEVLNVPPYNALRSIADIIGSGSNGAYHKLIAAEASAYLIFNRDTAYSIRHGAYGKVALVMAVMVVDVFKSVKVNGGNGKIPARILPLDPRKLPFLL